MASRLIGTARLISTARLQALRHTAATAAAAAARPSASAPPSPPARDLEARSDTRHNVAAPPVVFHPLYSAPRLSPGHRFPMVWLRRPRLPQHA